MSRHKFISMFPLTDERNKKLEKEGNGQSAEVGRIKNKKKEKTDRTRNIWLSFPFYLATMVWIFNILFHCVCLSACLCKCRSLNYFFNM